jgi:hypothetical protein
MHWGKSATILMVSALLLGGCSTRPRYFVATINPPVSSTVTFDNDMALCRELVGRGYKSNFKAQAAAIGLGTVAGTVVVGAAQAAAINATISGLATGTGSTAGASALAVAAPVIGIAVGFGVSRIIRSGREKKLKKTLSNCLTEYGYTVEKWTPAKRPKPPRKNAKAPPVIDAPVQQDAGPIIGSVPFPDANRASDPVLALPVPA